MVSIASLGLQNSQHKLSKPLLLHFGLQKLNDARAGHVTTERPDDDDDDEVTSLCEYSPISIHFIPHRLSPTASTSSSLAAAADVDEVSFVIIT